MITFLIKNFAGDLHLPRDHAADAHGDAVEQGVQRARAHAVSFSTFLEFPRFFEISVPLVFS